MIIPIAHDFTCPWCWIGFMQAKALRKEFPGIKFEWRGYELYPESMDWPPPAPVVPEGISLRPKTPTRLELAYAAQGMIKPTAIRPKQMRIHNAHEAVEYAKLEGRQDAMVEALYRAYWEEGLEISNLDVLHDVALGLVEDRAELRRAVEQRRFADKIVPYDDEAYASGVFNVPTFWIGGERYAEQPLMVLRQAVAAAMKLEAALA